MPISDLKRRVGVAAILLALYLLSVLLGVVTFPGYQNATGLRDIGHYYVPSLALMFRTKRAEYILWLGTLPEELFFGVIAGVVLFTGRGVRLELCVYFMYFLHWLCLHATTLPAPDNIIWRFPPGTFTFGKPDASDFWFSGYVANAFIFALAADRSRLLWLRVVMWSFFVFQILLVLSARTHYTIDVIGGVFVAYSVNRVSLDMADAWQRRMEVSQS